jgi:hypothetical protein
LRGCDGLWRSKQGSRTVYWVGMMRQLRPDAAALRVGTAAVVVGVARGGGGWCAVFRGGIVAKRQLLLSAGRAADEVRCRVVVELTLQRTSGCLGSVSPPIHSLSTRCPLSVQSALRAALLLLRVSLSSQSAHEAERWHVKLAGARRCEWQHTAGYRYGCLDTGLCDELARLW